MPQPLFLQNIIACIWDFDKTLVPGYMQEPLFAHYQVDPKKFWREVAELPNYYRKCGLEMIAPDTAYLNHILTYTREGNKRARYVPRAIHAPRGEIREPTGRGGSAGGGSKPVPTAGGADGGLKPVLTAGGGDLERRPG